MTKLRLTFACGPYDRTQSLRDGTLTPEGIDLVYLPLQPAEIFWRMLQYREFDASEMSLSNYTTLVSQGDPPFIAIPAFPSRVFRHGYFFINTDAGIRHPGDLKGKRGGVPEYSMTAAVYMRAACWSTNTASCRATSNGCRAAPTASATRCRRASA
jgi:4,5-dihydroxyphthalate decarboxylase